MIGPKLRLPRRPVVCHTRRADRMSYINMSWFTVNWKSGRIGLASKRSLRYVFRLLFCSIGVEVEDIGQVYRSLTNWQLLDGGPEIPDVAL